MHAFWGRICVHIRGAYAYPVSSVSLRHPSKTRVRGGRICVTSGGAYACILGAHMRAHSGRMCVSAIASASASTRSSARASARAMAGGQWRYIGVEFVIIIIIKIIIITNIFIIIIILIIISTIAGIIIIFVLVATVTLKEVGGVREGGRSGGGEGSKEGRREESYQNKNNRIISSPVDICIFVLEVILFHAFAL